MNRLLQRLARAASACLLLAVVAMGILALSGRAPAQAAGPDRAPAAPTPTPAYTQIPAAAPGQRPAPTQRPVSTPAPTAAPVPSAAPEEESAYDYAAPVPESGAVDDAWFADAAFIGDSRTEGLVLYTTLKPGGAFAYRGLNVQSARTDRVIKVDGARYTAVEALERGAFAKVYLSLGVNELGWYNNGRYSKNYADLIDLVRAAQPGAEIYLQTLIPVTAEKSAASYINNPTILVYNDIIRTLAEEKQVYLVDVWSAFADEDGALPAEGSVDGVHLTKAYYGRWLDYLKTHTAPAAD